ncbi:glycosyltransferase 87 family protein [Hymenobacter sp. ASUV-10]|uniref:Glycosyltransferase 87 family protein n=1 Tax=Hymenobacter aranciens TaxID=3063996 RepID=A0ABT9BCA7_9BACT|nr:glycosyltransferase 87 family protein [Hymenobacter sp. ASUV-10]MDO7875899.1 glycosyltransferase 87 family protein [Hymenobacter sp. ASUV-10]
MKPRPQVITGSAAALSGLAYLVLAYVTPRADFLQLVLLFGVALVSYVVLLRSGISWQRGLGLALLLRLLWLPATPALSDDFYRFRWDGLLVANGINPFQFRPTEIAPAVALKPGLQPTLAHLFPRLNSPDYYSVYPPVCQFIFGAAAKLFPASEIGFIIALRLILLAAECASAWLLLQLLELLKQPRKLALYYLLHPLVIIELVGNLHFEVLVIALVLLAAWLLARQKTHRSALALALAVATKLLPVVVLPLLIKRLGWRQFIIYLGAFSASLVLLFLPFASTELIGNISNSLRLYFHRFEFNASLYYLLRAVGFRLSGYNEIAIIGPGLALVSALTVLTAVWLQRRSLAGLAVSLLLILSVYYLCATTVHPWYITPLIAVSVFTRFRYPLVWGGMAILSYAAYRDAVYTENLGLVSLEYAVTLAWLGYELFSTRLANASLPAPRP